MPKATRKTPRLLITPPERLSLRQRSSRIRDRNKWLMRIDFLDALNELFDHLPEYHVFLKRRAGELMFVSRNMLHTLRLSDEAALIGTLDQDLTPGPLADLYTARDETVLRTGQPLLGVVEVWFTREGLPQWFICYKMPLRDRKGAIVGVIGFLKEFTHPSSLPVPEPIGSIVKYIKANLWRRLTVDELADSAHISRRQMERLFKESVGISPKSFITKERIHEAARLITQTELTLSHIAIEVGFSDQSAMTFYFKRELGITPKKLRRAATLWKKNSLHEDVQHGKP